MRSPTSPQMKAQWSVNLSMNTPTTLSVLVPAYNEQYLVYASLEREQVNSRAGRRTVYTPVDR